MEIPRPVLFSTAWALSVLREARRIRLECIRVYGRDRGAMEAEAKLRLDGRAVEARATVRKVQDAARVHGVTFREVAEASRGL